MSQFHARELDRFVAECDRLGGLNHPHAQGFLNDFSVAIDTRVDQSLDPFSEEYFEDQLALYKELSGRDLDQKTGELTPLDVDAHTNAGNPYNSRDSKFIARHARVVLTALMIADLPHGAEILDAGSGWGLSSEVMAFCGARVTAIDINPLFVELIRRRADRLALPIEAVHSEFDAFDTSRRFDLLLFYECLHHSLRPWETLERLGRFVKPDGKIVFAGEPVNHAWWRNWGIRLDSHSVYCIRKFGWWESGWTAEFIADCFARAGYALDVYHHIGLNNGPIGVAVRAEAQPKPQVDLTVYPPFQQETARVYGALSKAWRATGPIRKAWRALNRRRAA